VRGCRGVGFFLGQTEVLLEIDVKRGGSKHQLGVRVAQRA
jgi:hypothetical protein